MGQNARDMLFWAAFLQSWLIKPLISYIKLFVLFLVPIIMLFYYSPTLPGLELRSQYSCSNFRIQDDLANSCPVSYRTINQYGGTTCRPSLSRVNPDTIGCVWTGEFDLNTLRVNGESCFESGKKTLRIQK